MIESLQEQNIFYFPLNKKVIQYLVTVQPFVLLVLKFFPLGNEEGVGIWPLNCQPQKVRNEWLYTATTLRPLHGVDRGGFTFC